MRIWDRFAGVLAFRSIPATVAVLLVYVVVYVAVFITDDLPSVPSPKCQHGLNLDEAYKDLHQIAGIAHPYNSHQNDVVREHILRRVGSIAQNSKIVQISDDKKTNVTFSRSGMVAYFESLNVLVKIDGSKPDLDGVLFSAHFDSVSTAPGATDDGMGVVTLIQLIDYFSKNQPMRTLVFNINDGEEDGLYGAQVFLEHPWFKSVKSFVNVEGAGSGGRPLLLRATSTKLAKAFSHAKHPHGNAISADAFARGVVKSGTDYTVYTIARMQGLDFTFYRQRNKYHTKDDSVPSLGGKAALWDMLEGTLMTGLALANDGSSDDDTSMPVYFDVFGAAMVVASEKTFLVINVMLLVICPVAVGLLAFVAYKRDKLQLNRRSWGRFSASALISGIFTFGTAWLFTTLNPYIVYSSVETVLFACLAAGYIGIFAANRLLDNFFPITQNKDAILLESFAFWWLFLLVDAIYIGSKEICGLFFITFFYAGTTAALLVGLSEHFGLPPTIRSRLPEWLQSNRSNTSNGQQTDEAEPSERTPLIQNGHHSKPIDGQEELGVWFIQFLLAVPFPLILISQVGLMLLNSLNQTLVDGSPASVVYLGVAFVSFLSFAPLIPFAHKVHRFVASAALVVFLVTVFYNVFAFPFSTNSSYKVFFQQEINIDSGENSVTLTGMKPWLMQYIIPEIPSAWGQDLSCGPDPIRSDVPSCKWQSIPPTVAPGPSKKWITVQTKRLSPGSGEITISGTNTRNCRLYLDTPVHAVHVHGSSGKIQPLFPIPKDGVNEVRLWSRDWDRDFKVDITWDASVSSGLAGRAACEWSEQDNVPALKEVIAFLPTWARVTKRTDGLVEGWKAFSV